MLGDAPNQELLDRWRAGDELAARVLVDRYMARLTALARSRLSRKLQRRLDAEDVVLSAWRSFFVATWNGRIAADGEGDLWPLLVTLTLRKLNRQAVRHKAGRRSLDAEQPLDLQADWQATVSRDPSPDDVAVLTDEVEALLAALEPSDREVLTLTLQGENQPAIAETLGCSERTVRRSLARIREVIASRRAAGSIARRPWNGGESSEPPASSRPPVSHRIAAASGTPSPTIDYSEILLHELIGEGGFGKVYRATRRTDSAVVAVKYLKKRFWKNAAAVDALVDETAIVASLSHSGIVRQHGWGRSPQGATFLVMELIDGPNLEDWLAVEQPAIPEIIRCGIAIADVLVAAHRERVLHGDITPRNVLRASDGRFVLTDFGFARSRGQTIGSRPHGGTPGFLAPEQVSEAFGVIDARTDVYGLGGLLYALLTRQPPMSGDDVPTVLAKVLSSRAAEPLSAFRQDVPIELERLVMQCLQKASPDRPESATAVRSRLTGISE